LWFWEGVDLLLESGETRSGRRGSAPTRAAQATLSLLRGCSCEIGFRSHLGLDGVGFEVSGRGQCRVAAFKVFARLVLAIFFITISHCAWRRVISFSKAKKKRSKENALTALP
jgi:hypothetical protein